jgi:hypothetical protein
MQLASKAGVAIVTLSEELRTVGEVASFRAMITTPSLAGNF